MKHNTGIGATPELSLRVSVATLVRVLFKDPTNGELMLALERKATLHKTEVEVKSQPFGGAIRILDLNALHDLIGDFHFDSELSSSEQDFRLFIRPSSWSAIREICIERLSTVDDPILETDPVRELAEEFADALQVNLKPEQYTRMPVATVIENEATPTQNIHAKGMPTARVYRIFEAAISDTSLVDIMIKNSADVSHQELCQCVFEDAQNSGEGRANAILTLPVNRLMDFYLAKSPQERNSSTLFEQHRLDETVLAVLEDITVPKYRRLW